VTPSPPPDFAHLIAMTDGRGTFEHAELARPRPEHGYCTDDMSRVLLVTTREPTPSPAVRRLIDLSLRFLAAAQAMDGRYRNRLDAAGRWQDRPSLDDCWGRSIWALGTAAAHTDSERVRQTATAQFERAATQRAPAIRSMAFAAIGAAELLAAHPEHRGARDLLLAAATRLGDDAGTDREVDAGATWPWPEPRLTYANAVLPEAMIATGAALGQRPLVERGLTLLRWLLDQERAGGHLSVTPVGGAGPGDGRPAFDQQPIEAAAIADACARATMIDRDQRWSDGVAAAVDWFAGDNDGGHVMWDPETGGGYDGLQPDGPNLNQGTESTLALLSTLQHGRQLVTTPA
jgi:hypothetical protein